MSQSWLRNDLECPFSLYCSFSNAVCPSQQTSNNKQHTSIIDNFQRNMQHSPCNHRCHWRLLPLTFVRSSIRQWFLPIGLSRTISVIITLFLLLIFSHHHIFYCHHSTIANATFPPQSSMSSTIAAIVDICNIVTRVIDQWFLPIGLSLTISVIITTLFLFINIFSSSYFLLSSFDNYQRNISPAIIAVNDDCCHCWHL